MNTKECIVDGCNNISHARNYCVKHYNQILRHGKITIPKDPNEPKETCSIENCSKQIYAKHLCRYHYEKHWKEIKEQKICKVDGCNDFVLAKGYCVRHYKQIKKYNKIISVDRVREKERKICIVEGCEEKSHALGYCERHYNKYRKYGDPLYGRTYIKNKAK